MEKKRRDSAMVRFHRDSAASTSSLTTPAGRVSRRGPSRLEQQGSNPSSQQLILVPRRDKLVQQLLRATHDAYPVRMSIQVELEVPMG